MKFMSFTMFDVAKAAEVAAAGDTVSNTPGRKVLAQYLCEAIPFPGVPPNTIVVVAITEAESNEAISAAMYPVMLAGATVHMVPVLEMPVGGAAETEKQYRA